MSSGLPPAHLGVSTRKTVVRKIAIEFASAHLGVSTRKTVVAKIAIARWASELGTPC